MKKYTRNDIKLSTTPYWNMESEDVDRQNEIDERCKEWSGELFVSVNPIIDELNDALSDFDIKDYDSYEECVTSFRKKILTLRNKLANK